MLLNQRVIGFFFCFIFIFSASADWRPQENDFNIGGKCYKFANGAAQKFDDTCPKQVPVLQATADLEVAKRFKNAPGYTSQETCVRVENGSRYLISNGTKKEVLGHPPNKYFYCNHISRGTGVPVIVGGYGAILVKYLTDQGPLPDLTNSPCTPAEYLAIASDITDFKYKTSPMLHYNESGKNEGMCPPTKGAVSDPHLSSYQSAMSSGIPIIFFDNKCFYLGMLGGSIPQKVDRGVCYTPNNELRKGVITASDDTSSKFFRHYLGKVISPLSASVCIKRETQYYQLDKSKPQQKIQFSNTALADALCKKIYLLGDIIHSKIWDRMPQDKMTGDVKTIQYGFRKYYPNSRPGEGHGDATSTADNPRLVDVDKNRCATWTINECTKDTEGTIYVNRSGAISSCNRDAQYYSTDYAEVSCKPKEAQQIKWGPDSKFPNETKLESATEYQTKDGNCASWTTKPCEGDYTYYLGKGADSKIKQCKKGQRYSVDYKTGPCKIYCKLGSSPENVTKSGAQTDTSAYDSSWSSLKADACFKACAKEEKSGLKCFFGSQSYVPVEATCTIKRADAIDAESTVLTDPTLPPSIKFFYNDKDSEGKKIEAYRNQCTKWIETYAKSLKRQASIVAEFKSNFAADARTAQIYVAQVTKDDETQFVIDSDKEKMTCSEIMKKTGGTFKYNNITIRSPITHLIDTSCKKDASKNTQLCELSLDKGTTRVNLMKQQDKATCVEKCKSRFEGQYLGKKLKEAAIDNIAFDSWFSADCYFTNNQGAIDREVLDYHIGLVTHSNK